MSKLDDIRRDVPAAVTGITQIAVDNPVQVLLVGCAGVVAARLIGRAVRPSSLPVTIATMVVAAWGNAAAVRHAISRGLINLRIRDGDGGHVTL